VLVNAFVRHDNQLISPMHVKISATPPTPRSNDWQTDPENIPREYDGRAEIETIIRDLKHAQALGKAPGSQSPASLRTKRQLALVALANALAATTVDSTPRTPASVGTTVDTSNTKRSAHVGMTV